MRSSKEIHGVKAFNLAVPVSPSALTVSPCVFRTGRNVISITPVWHSCLRVVTTRTLCTRRDYDCIGRRVPHGKKRFGSVWERSTGVAWPGGYAGTSDPVGRTFKVHGYRTKIYIRDTGETFTDTSVLITVSGVEFSMIGLGLITPGTKGPRKFDTLFKITQFSSERRWDIHYLKNGSLCATRHPRTLPVRQPPVHPCDPIRPRSAKFGKFEILKLISLYK